MNVFVVRRSILKALREAHPAPLETAEVAAALPLGGHGEAAIGEELHMLEIYGYVENLRGDASRPPWWRLTATGLAQLTREAPRLDISIWGKLAL